MPLSWEEQRLLDGIESGLRADEPTFAAKLNLFIPFRRQLFLAHGILWLAMCVCLIGFGLMHQVVGAGVILVLNGFGLLIIAIVMVVRLHCPDSRSAHHPML